MDGMEAFYTTTSKHPCLVRHQIGGVSAAAMQRQLMSNSVAAATEGDAGAGEKPVSPKLHNADKIEDLTCAPPVPDPRARQIDDENFFSKPRQLYVDGLTPGFLDALDPDVWPRDPWLRVRAPPQPKLPRGTHQGDDAWPLQKLPQPNYSNRMALPAKRACTRPVGGAPTHAEQRSNRRELTQTEPTTPEPPSAHPLLANAPLPPASPGRPSPAAQLRRILPVAGNSVGRMGEGGVEGEEDCSWPCETRIFQRPRKLVPLALCDGRMASDAETAAMVQDARQFV